jgi:hypothetical protein
MLSSIKRAQQVKIIARKFSTVPSVETAAEPAKSKLKATPESGFVRKQRKNEEVVGFRPNGHTSLTGETKNYNFSLKR